MELNEKVLMSIGISQLLLDVCSKTNNFLKRFLYFRPKLAAH